MIRTRRLYAYSEKLYTYFLLIILFASALFTFNLYLQTTELFLSFSSSILVILSSAGIVYGIYLLILLIMILVKDHMFLFWKLLRTLLYMSVCSIILILVQVVYTLSEQGLHVGLIL